MNAYRDQSKGFTLINHFKLYRAKPKTEDKVLLSEKLESASSFKQFSYDFLFEDELVFYF